MLGIREAIAETVRRFPDSLTVSTCGFITRDLYNTADRPENFYLVGSMGMAAPVGLGVALARPDRYVVVLDGDGSFAMNLSVLPMIAEHRPALVHVVLDNGAHESTGGQRPVHIGDPAGLALAAGYAAAHCVATLEELRAAECAPDGPTLLHVRCARRGAGAGRRVEPTPQQLVARFRAAATA
ncbi:thiamine pyrophosphate-dependent enzyme [Streptomyces sp. NPDC092296]|uniref:thiamine pyrophosphate-dependent enzyme n=1 Tax=Streptomyces sp. NPDC092296 TaxID=3366012 RepID=UPI0037FA4C14